MPETEKSTMLPVVYAAPWQMSYGERLAFEGVLAQAAPRLAVEIGTAEGGSLRRIAAHSEEVHSFDLVPPLPEVETLANVTFHTGDSHTLVPDFLAEMARQERSIDFVLIDGDHSADGVRRDIEDVLGSDAITHTVIVLHDTLNPEVRQGIVAADIAAHPKVALFELDLVPGYVARREPYRLQMWGGLGLVVVDADQREATPEMVLDTRFHELFAVLRPAVGVLAQMEANGTALDELPGADVEAALQGELASHQGALAALEDPALRTELARALAAEAQLAHRLHMIETSRGWRTVMLLRSVRDLLRRR
jgi:hypothetical protein